jgi:hypothetical protein
LRTQVVEEKAKRLRWVAVAAALVLGLITGVGQDRAQWRYGSFAVLALALALKLTARTPLERTTWVRFTILELAWVPTLTGRYPQPPFGPMLAILALTFVTTPTVPTRFGRRALTYAAPLALLIVMHVVPFR